MRLRWALEEVGLPYTVRPVSFAVMKDPAHRNLQPFGQIPTYEESGLTLFETGAIVFHIAGRHDGLLPRDANARARAINWMFAALSSIEPTIVDREVVLYLERDENWFEQRLALAEIRFRARLTDLSRRLGDAGWLEEFTNLAACVTRAEARPAFRRVFVAQKDFFNAAAEP